MTALFIGGRKGERADGIAPWWRGKSILSREATLILCMNHKADIAGHIHLILKLY